MGTERHLDDFNRLPYEYVFVLLISSSTTSQLSGIFGKTVISSPDTFQFRFPTLVISQVLTQLISHDYYEDTITEDYIPTRVPGQKFRVTFLCTLFFVLFILG